MKPLLSLSTTKKLGVLMLSMNLTDPIHANCGVEKNPMGLWYRLFKCTFL